MRFLSTVIYTAVLAMLLGPAAAKLQAAHSMLYAPSEEDDPAFRAAISALISGPVDYFDARSATPTLSQLSEYDCVHTWANGAYSNSTAFGDNLAAYVDAGGRAILGVFDTFTGGNHLTGTIMTPGYSPVFSPTGNNHYTFSSYAGDGTVFHSGVTSYAITYRDYLALQGGGIVDAHYLDGEIAVAYRPDLGVVYVNGSGAVQLSATGDWARLIANTCLVGEVTSAVPEPSMLVIVPLLVLMAPIAARCIKRIGVL